MMMLVAAESNWHRSKRFVILRRLSDSKQQPSDIFTIKSVLSPQGGIFNFGHCCFRILYHFTFTYSGFTMV